MYLPGTSDGTESHINDTSGGHCNDTKKGIFMKIEVYVCKKNNLNDTGIFISLPRSCFRPAPFSLAPPPCLFWNFSGTLAREARLRSTMGK